MMSFWTFSDVFEEGGPIATPFEGNFGLIAKGGIKKPSYYAFALLHQLGDARIAIQSKDAIATRTDDGSLRVVAWNIVDPGTQGPSRTMRLVFSGIPANAVVTIQRVDRDHGNVLPKYRAMGSPVDPNPEQVRELNRETNPGAPEQTHLGGGSLDLTLTPNALVLVEVK
jgi:xylan 1,4-beta-xylosidase